MLRIKRIFLLPLIVVLLATSGCSVFMAASGPREPDFSKIAIGATRAEVHHELGKPTELISHPNGTRELYEFQIGNGASYKRAFANAGLDLMTVFLFEIYSTRAEQNRAKVYNIVIEFNRSGKVIAISKS